MERDMGELILDTRMDKNGNLKDENVKKLQKYGEEMVRMKNKSSVAMYKWYQNL